MHRIKLKNARKKNNLTQEVVATSLCMDVSNYSRRENGQIRISKEEWEKLSEILEVPLDSIYENDNDSICGQIPSVTGAINSNLEVPKHLLEYHKKIVEILQNENYRLRERIKILERKE